MRATTLAIVLALGSVGATPSRAYAQSTGADGSPGDMVFLRGGKILRGHVTESGATVAIRLANGDVVTIPVSEIDRIDRATPCAFEDPPSARAGHPAVLVHILSPEPVELEWLADGEWETVCTSPCDVRLPTQRRYRINGEGLRPSRTVSFADRTACVDLHVRPSPSAWHVPGVVATSVGGGIIGLGFVWSLAAAIAEGDRTEADPVTTDHTGPILMIAGAVTLTAGVAMLIASRRTAVTVLGLKSATSDASASQPPRTWTVASTDARALPTPQLFPIFQATF